MEFDIFVEKVRTLVEEIAKERNMEVRVNAETIVKNNGCRLKCLSIFARGSNVSPSVYMERYYEQYNNGRMLQDIVEEIVDSYGDRREQGRLDISKFTDYDNVRDFIIMMLVNRELNSEMLTNAPYIPFEDLAIVFRWLAVKSPESIGTSLVTNRDIRRWGVNVRELYDIASENTRRLFPEHVENLVSLLMRQYGIDVKKDGMAENNPEKDPEKDMYIITNSYYTNGAAAMLYPGVLARCADMLDGDIYIIPSSIHEVLFVKAGNGVDAKDIIECIILANKKIVKKSEKLSDNLYIYRRREDKVEILK